MIDTTSVDLLVLVGGDLKKKGAKEWTGACPICRDGEDRFNVQPDNHRWLCRNCTDGKWKDAISFLQMRDGLTVAEACKQLGIENTDYTPANGRKKPDMLAIPEDDTPEWKRKLMARGISESTIDRYRITEAGKYWRYPSIGSEGSVIYRHKKIVDDGKFKYWTDWDGREATPKVPRPDDTTYYSCGGLVGAIKANAGTLWLSSGEPNVWALHSALCADNPTQAVNATFWMDGEINMPESIVSDLSAWGVKRVMYAPDCDTTGVKSAYELRNALKDSDIELIVYQLPGAQDSKYDLGDLWLDHDKSKPFADVLVTLPVFKFDADKPQEKPLSVSSDDTMNNLLDRIDGTSVISGEPLVVPMKAFHGLGGFARVIMPGKLVGVIAPSGHGKTSFLETWVDRWCELGHSGLWYGTEWTPDEYQDRRIQRYGGATYEQWMLFELWKKEEQLGVPIDRRYGVKMDNGLLGRSAQIAVKLANCKGKIHYFPDSMLSLEMLLQHMATQMRILRSAGERVNFAVFDYVQLLRVSTVMEGTNRHEFAVELVKQWAIANDIVVLLGSQVTKDESRQNKTAKGLINSDGALYLRDDKFNLFITLNVVYEEDPRDSDKMIRTNRGVANVTKNSPGRTGAIDMVTVFEKLTWKTEEEATTKRNTDLVAGK